LFRNCAYSFEIGAFQSALPVNLGKSELLYISLCIKWLQTNVRNKSVCSGISDMFVIKLYAVVQMHESVVPCQKVAAAERRMRAAEEEQRAAAEEAAAAAEEAEKADRLKAAEEKAQARAVSATGRRRPKPKDDASIFNKIIHNTIGADGGVFRQ
jgi:hypothetical protein